MGLELGDDAIAQGRPIFDDIPGSRCGYIYPDFRISPPRKKMCRNIYSGELRVEATVERSTQNRTCQALSLQNKDSSNHNSYLLVKKKGRLLVSSSVIVAAQLLSGVVA